jgi:heptosyltransferase II
MKRILIIKLGYSETLDSMMSLTTSLGDVLRTTVILHFFKNDRVEWLVDEKASPLLEGISLINTIWPYNPHVMKELRSIKYDVVINFEKIPDVCAFAQSLDTGEFFGFLYNGATYEARTHRRAAQKLVELSRDLDKKRQNTDSWQKVLCEAIGHQWNGQPYLLGYKPQSDVVYDVGFNWATSSKWKNKTWPEFHWRTLEGLLTPQLSVSWQKGLNSLNDYIDWIHSCKCIVTSDSLGLHIALALGKRVVALFGPTSHHEMYLYNFGTYLVPQVSYDCIPCLKPVCERKRQCMEFIDPAAVKLRIYEELKTCFNTQAV